MTMFRRHYLAVCLIGCTTLVATAAEPAPLIPRSVLFGNPEHTSPEISPDGKYLAYIAPDKNNVLQVWVRTIGKADDKIVTDDKKRGIRMFTWAYDGEHIGYMQDTAGDENFHLYAVSLKTGQSRDLTPHKGVRAQPLPLNPQFPNEVLVVMNKTSPMKMDVYRINIATGDEQLDTENPGLVMQWVADRQNKIRAGVAVTLKDGGRDLMVREAVDQPWKTALHWAPDEEGSAFGFSNDGKTLYIAGNHNAPTERLLALDPASGKETVMAEDPNYDVGEPMVQPTQRVIQAVHFNRDKPEWKILDRSIADDFAALAKVRPGDFNVVSRDLEDKTWVVSYSADDKPTYYYLYDRASKKAELLFSSQPKLEKVPLAKMQPISYKARDGLTIHGYLTTPPGVEAKNLPTVLLVHGGPWARDSWGFSPMPQWLANRGYAVLQVNYRGSTGYGKQFLNAGNKEWAAKMHDDLIDAVDWIVKQGVADKKKVAIMGGSYGGYATLVGLTFTPDVFACGVDIVGPSNLASLLKTIPPYWTPMRAIFDKRVGSIEKEEDFLKSRSPLFKVDQIKVPLLIGQGANDPRVKQAESDQIAEAMRKAGRPVEYVVYTDEGHGFARPENRLHFYAKAEEFLAKYLGGRAEPVGEISGHSGVSK
jgi:dipeptidyl aminopeptidase/acylaminoacyl peptidase